MIILEEEIYFYLILFLFFLTTDVLYVSHDGTNCSARTGKVIALIL